MDELKELLSSATGLAVVMAPVIVALLQLVKNPIEKLKNKEKVLLFLPHIAGFLGVIAGLVFGSYLQQDLFTYGLGGLLAGLSAVGIYEAVKNPIDFFSRDERKPLE